MNKSTTFYEALQKDERLDLRDNRGKKHKVGVILVEFVIALLCNRDGKLSSIHRHMSAHHEQIVLELGVENSVPKKQCLGLICLLC
ncbi:MAG: hypothetical protein AAFN93_26835 [Bacteroidota bacterium]